MLQFSQVFHTVFPESKRDFGKVRNVEIMEFPMWKHDSESVVRLEVVKEEEQDSSRQLQTSLCLNAKDVRAFTRWICPGRDNPDTP